MCETQSSAARPPTQYSHRLQISQLIQRFAIFSMDSKRACLLYRRADIRIFLHFYSQQKIIIESLLGGEPALAAIDNKSSRRRHTERAVNQSKRGESPPLPSVWMCHLKCSLMCHFALSVASLTPQIISRLAQTYSRRKYLIHCWIHLAPGSFCHFYASENWSQIDFAVD